MSLRLRVAKLYQWFDNEGSWPYEPNSGNGPARASIALVAVLVSFFFPCAAICEESCHPTPDPPAAQSLPR
jgi:hypothetical protein